MPLNLPLSLTRTGAGASSTTASKQAPQLVIEFDLKTKPQALDIELTPWSITVNQRPYFARSYFSGEVNVEGATTIVNDAAKKVRILVPLKDAPGADASGDSAQSVTIPESDAAALGLPAKIEEWRTRRVAQAKALGTQAAKTASDLALHSGMAAESAVKDRMEAAEQIEKERATAEVFKTLSSLEREREPAKAEAAGVVSAEPPNASAAAPPTVPSSASSSAKKGKDIYAEDDGEDDDDQQKRGKQDDSLPTVSLPTRTLPPPRGAAAPGTVPTTTSAPLSFTPRVLPTPLRESKVAEETEYLMQQQLAQQAAKARAAAAAAASTTGPNAGKSAAEIAKASAEASASAAQAYYRGIAFAEAGDLTSALSAFNASVDKYNEVLAAGIEAAGGSDPLSIKRGQSAAKAAACAYALGKASSGGNDNDVSRLLALWQESSQAAHDSMALSRSKNGSLAAAVIMASGGGFSSPAAVKDDLIRHACLKAAVDAANASAAARKHKAVPAVVPSRAALADESLLGGTSTVLPALLAALVDIAGAAAEEDRLRTIAKLVGASSKASDETGGDDADEKRSLQHTALTRAVEAAPFKLLALQNMAAFHMASAAAAATEEKGETGTSDSQQQARRACISACSQALDGLEPAALRDALTALPMRNGGLPAHPHPSQHYLKAYASLCVMRATCTLEHADDEGQEEDKSKALALAIADYERAVLATPDDADLREDLRDLRERGGTSQHANA